MSIQASRRALWTVSLFVLIQYLAISLIAPFAVAQAKEKVQVPVGTVVDLVFDSAVNPKTTTIGQTVTLRVANPVLVNGATVVAAGALAQGEVTVAQKAGAVGKEAQIGVVVKQVAAVDGTVIPINGTKSVIGENKQTSSLVITLLCCILGLLQQGGSAEIAAGSALRATVAAPVEVTPQ